MNKKIEFAVQFSAYCIVLYCIVLYWVLPLHLKIYVATHNNK